MQSSRRLFVASAALTSVGCGTTIARFHGVPLAVPKPTPQPRMPQMGQEWRYIQRDFFSGKSLGIVVEKIERIGQTITIARTDENGSPLPSEIQESPGMVSTDPHWGKVLQFNPAIPLWPQEMSGSWSKQVVSKYTIDGYPQNQNNWQLYMSSHGWEKLTVAAGDFVTLRFQNLIHYESEDDNKVNCIRRETLWFAPQIGRWVARESSGSYQLRGQIGAVLLDDSVKSELLFWK